METFTQIRSSFRDFLSVVFKRKIQMGLFFIITVCIIVGGTFLIEPKYRAKAQLLVKIGKQNVYTQPSLEGKQIINVDLTNQINSEIEFLKSRSLAEKVLNRLGPFTVYPEKKGPISDTNQGDLGSKTQSFFEKRLLKFRDNLSIKGIIKSSIIQINFKHKSPEIAASVVNSLVEVYLDEHIQLHKSTQSPTFFKNQSLRLKNKLDEMENKLMFLKKENNITVLEEQQKLLLKQIFDLRVDLNQTLSKDVETRSRVLQIEKQLLQTPETIFQAEETNQNELLISSLEAKLVELQLEEKKLLLNYTPQSRKIKNVRERIEIVENKLKSQESYRFNEELFRNKIELKALAVKKEIQKDQLAEYKSEIENLNQLEIKLGSLQQSIDLNRENYRLYLGKLETLRIEAAMDNEKINNIIPLGRAFPPIKPFSPNYFLNIILSILIGGIGGILLVIIGEYLDDSLEKPEDVERTLQLAVLTNIPDVDKRARLDHQKVETLPSNLRIKLS